MYMKQNFLKCKQYTLQTFAKTNDPGNQETKFLHVFTCDTRSAVTLWEESQLWGCSPGAGTFVAAPMTGSTLTLPHGTATHCHWNPQPYFNSWRNDKNRNMWIWYADWKGGRALKTDRRSLKISGWHSIQIGRELKTGGVGTQNR